MRIENEMTKVKVNNEIDLCEVSSEKVRRKIEAALQYARVSYFLRWQEPGFFARLFLHERTKLYIILLIIIIAVTQLSFFMNVQDLFSVLMRLSSMMHL
mgnify:CR=1 FL=1